MGAKIINRDLLNRIREQFEAGYNLYDLSIENFLNYDTLKNISSQEGWKKGARIEAIRIAELNLESEKTVKARQIVKNNYKTMTKQLRKIIMNAAKDDNSPQDIELEGAILNRVKAIGELYKIDKDLHNITNSKEEADILQKRLKNQKLKEDLLQDNKPPHIH